MKARVLLVFAAVFCLAVHLAAASEMVGGVSHTKALALGERMYRDGILPSGTPMKALVMGDIPFDGRMFTCDDCHQRSGLGSEEGTIITWPINGKELYAPRRRTGAYKPATGTSGQPDSRRNLPQYYQVEDARPAYTDATLAKVMRSGVDPTGRRLDPVMPKYRLGRSNMDLLVYYLRHLSTEPTQGVDGETLHFATIITDDVSQQEQSAMLSVLDAHIDARNSQSRHEERRSAAGPFYKSERHKSYRRLKLHVWQLKGGEGSWREQLERFYVEQPVFALLGGITKGSWQVMHVFSEEHKIPCIFPITNHPVISENDWYTLYFGKGYYQEGESAAKYVRAQFGMDKPLRIVQVFKEENEDAVAISRGFTETWKNMGGQGLEDMVVTADHTTLNRVWDDVVTQGQPDVVLIWLGNADTEAFGAFADSTPPSTVLFASATLLDRQYKAVPPKLRESLLLTYPMSLPDEQKRRQYAVSRWLEARKIPAGHFDIEAKMYFLGWLLPGSLKNMRSEFFREYFLEGFDMMIDQDYAIAVYPRLTFGSGQRYASKGCYIVRLGEESHLIPVSDWVTY